MKRICLSLAAVTVLAVSACSTHAETAALTNGDAGQSAAVTRTESIGTPDYAIDSVKADVGLSAGS